MTSTRNLNSNSPMEELRLADLRLKWPKCVGFDRDVALIDEQNSSLAPISSSSAFFPLARSKKRSCDSSPILTSTHLNWNEGGF